jgi:DNA repair ATPase RecN
MIEYIEIKGFESHDHTIIDDVSPGLNLICGDSNAGKTSIVRAIKLVAYNEFDPKSVRVGCTECQVTVRTHRGEVKVTRGPKKNLWEVTPKGKPTEHFDKVGRSVVPRAAEILGLNVVTLGDVDVPVNIMDQLESHFMLAGIGNKDASGSMRAQVVDEISGLSGIEGVIKGVSLDNHRLGREVSTAEKEILKVEGELHNEIELGEENDRLKSAEELLKSHDECSELSGSGVELAESHRVVAVDAKRLKDGLDELPDVDKFKVVIKTASTMLDDASKALSVHTKGTVSMKEVHDLQISLAAIPDMDAAELDVVRDLLFEAQSARTTLDLLTDASGEVDELQAEADLLDRDLTGAVRTAQEAMERLEAARVVMKDVEAIQGRLDVLDDGIKEAERQGREALEEKDAVLAQVDLCPLTLGPVSDQCLEEAKK